MPDDLTPTPEDYAVDPREVLEVAAKATPGPWFWHSSGSFRDLRCPSDNPRHINAVFWYTTGDDGIHCSSGDEAFVALSRTALPALARRLIAAEVEVARLKDLLVRLYDSIDDTLDNGQAANDAAEALGREC